NLPLGLVALVVVRRALRHLPVAHQRRPIDVPGVVLFAVGLTALLVMITRVGQGVPLVQPDNLGLLVGAVVVLGAFVLILVGVIGVQLELSSKLENEVKQREAEAQRRKTLEQALAGPL
ncbi:hypothetical protein ABTL10_19100, partial [Acinetobacter baumannii]